MKKYKFLFTLIVLSLSLQTQAQWHKLPKQFYWDYIPFMPSAPQRFLVPAFVLPVADGHIFIAAYYHNGSVSAGNSYYIIHESFDDFSSYNFTPFGYLHPRNIAFTPNGNSIAAPLYHKKDSVFSWVEHVDNSLTHTFNPYRNRYTKNAFQTIDSAKYCYNFGPPFLNINCVTDHFMYSTSQNNYSDSLNITRADLANGATFCKKSGKYFAAWNPLKPVNDSTVVLYCSDKTHNPNPSILLKTIDYGQNWNEVYLDSVNTISNYEFTSNSVGYLLLSNNVLLKTTDGGGSWNSLAIPSSTPTCFSFLNDSVGYVGGKQGFLSKTTDGGQTWNNEVSGTNYTIKEVFTVTQNVAYFLDSISDIYKNTPLLVSVKEQSKSEKVSVFPNPANNSITVQSLYTELGLVTLYNILGETELQTTVSDSKTELNISALTPGVYQLMVKGGYIKVVKE